MVSTVSELPTLFPRSCTTQRARPGTICLFEHQTTLPTTTKPDHEFNSRARAICSSSTTRPNTTRPARRLFDTVHSPPSRHGHGFPRSTAWILRRRLGHGRWPTARARTSQLSIRCEERRLGVREERLRYPPAGNDSIPAPVAGSLGCGD